MNTSVWPIDGTLTGINTLDQSRPESNGNEGVPHILTIRSTLVSNSSGDPKVDGMSASFIYKVC